MVDFAVHEIIASPHAQKKSCGLEEETRDREEARSADDDKEDDDKEDDDKEDDDKEDDDKEDDDKEDDDKEDDERALEF